MIEYQYTLFDLKDVTSTSSRQKDRWSVRITHKPTGLFTQSAGVGKYEHALAERRQALEDLKQLVDKYYQEQYYGS
jgi:hypothetical protein